MTEKYNDTLHQNSKSAPLTATAKPHTPTITELKDTFALFMVKKYNEYGKNVSKDTAMKIIDTLLLAYVAHPSPDTLMNLFSHLITKPEGDLKSFLCRKLIMANLKEDTINE